MEKPMSPRIARLVLVITLAAVVAASAVAARSDAARNGGQLTLVAYSTPKEAFAKLIAGFQATAAGGGVTVDQSYGGSEAQSKAVDQGLPADVVNFSLQPD